MEAVILFEIPPDPNDGVLHALRGEYLCAALSDETLFNFPPDSSPSTTPDGFSQLQLTARGVQKQCLIFILLQRCETLRTMHYHE
ncbi:hypothetical protein AOLI_G00135330 [Acnodon oligacanthus]